MEIDGDSLNFLDICLIKKEEILIFDWFRKLTFSDRFLNYFLNYFNYIHSVKKLVRLLI